MVTIKLLFNTNNVKKMLSLPTVKFKLLNSGAVLVLTAKFFVGVSMQCVV